MIYRCTSTALTCHVSLHESCEEVVGLSGGVVIATSNLGSLQPCLTRQFQLSLIISDLVTTICIERWAVTMCQNRAKYPCITSISNSFLNYHLESLHKSCFLYIFTLQQHFISCVHFRKLFLLSIIR